MNRQRAWDNYSGSQTRQRAWDNYVGELPNRQRAWDIYSREFPIDAAPEEPEEKPKSRQNGASTTVRKNTKLNSAMSAMKGRSWYEPYLA